MGAAADLRVAHTESKDRRQPETAGQILVYLPNSGSRQETVGPLRVGKKAREGMRRRNKPVQPAEGRTAEPQVACGVLKG